MIVEKIVSLFVSLQVEMQVDAFILFRVCKRKKKCEYKNKRET